MGVNIQGETIVGEQYSRLPGVVRESRASAAGGGSPRVGGTPGGGGYSREVRHVYVHKGGAGGPTRLPCALECRRQNHFLNVDRMIATADHHCKDSGDADKLPIVELRPFTQREWRPSRSIPGETGVAGPGAAMLGERAFTAISLETGSGSKTDRSGGGGAGGGSGGGAGGAGSSVDNRGQSVSGVYVSGQPSGSRTCDFFESRGYPNPDKQTTTTTPRQNLAGPCQRAFSVAGERATPHPRPRDQGGVTKKTTDDHLDGFVPKLEREKSTVDELRTGHSVNSQFSCLKRALTDIDVRAQQRMLVNGKRIDHLPPKTSPLHYDLSDYYRMTRSFGNITQNAHASAQQSDELAESLFLRIEHLQGAYLDESIYDSFDRSNTLPSINVRKAPMKKRKGDPSRSRSSRSPSSKGSSAHKGQRSPAYRLGVTNSLDLLSHYGRQACVEHSLSNRLKTTLDHLRRTKDGSVIGGAFKLVPRYEWSPTHGESHLHQAVTANFGVRPELQRPPTKAATAHGFHSRATTYGQAEGDRGRDGVGDKREAAAAGHRNPVKTRPRTLNSRLHGHPAIYDKNASPDFATAIMSVGVNGHGKPCRAPLNTERTIDAVPEVEHSEQELNSCIAREATIEYNGLDANEPLELIRSSSNNADDEDDVEEDEDGDDDGEIQQQAEEEFPEAGADDESSENDVASEDEREVHSLLEEHQPEVLDSPHEQEILNHNDEVPPTEQCQKEQDGRSSNNSSVDADTLAGQNVSGEEDTRPASGDEGTPRDSGGDTSAETSGATTTTATTSEEVTETTTTTSQQGTSSSSFETTQYSSNNSLSSSTLLHSEVDPVLESQVMDEIVEEDEGLLEAEEGTLAQLAVDSKAEMLLPRYNVA